MRILIIGGTGTIGKRLKSRLEAEHTVITAGRSSGDVQVDITQEHSIRTLFQNLEPVDACIVVAASGPLDDFSTLDQAQLQAGMQGKLFGQINVVLIGQHYVKNNGVFVLTSGIFADIPHKGVTGGGVISGALHSFVLSAAIELSRGLRIHAISPGMVSDSYALYGHLFPTLNPIPMETLTNAYVECLTLADSGRIIRLYG